MASLPIMATRYKPGDAVCIATRAVAGHCRTPFFLRGKSGIIAEVLDRFRDPERLAYHKPGQPAQVLYKVRFAQTHVWTQYAGPPSDTLDADIYEQWLEPRT